MVAHINLITLEKIKIWANTLNLSWKLLLKGLICGTEDGPLGVRYLYQSATTGLDFYVSLKVLVYLFGFDHKGSQGNSYPEMKEESI